MIFLSAGAALAFLGMNSATGQCYRVVDLGTLGGSTSEAFAVNDFNRVIGQSQTRSQELHAFFWDNEPMMDLGTLGGTTSIAYDINNLSEIVGQSRIGSSQHATYWQNVLAVPADLGTLHNFGDSAAKGINDNSTIVGWTDSEAVCPNRPQLTLILGFLMQPTGAMTGLNAAGGFGGQQNLNAAAFAINTPVPGILPVSAGVGEPCGISTLFCNDLTSDSNAWINAGPTGPNDLTEPAGFGDGRGEARDVNDLEELVGWGRNQNDDCGDRALFWPTVGSVPDDIHTLAGIPATDQTKAEALNEAREIVGLNDTTNSAYLWTENAGVWSFADLNDEINSSCQAGGLLPWELLEARDINEDGWIVGLGSHPLPGHLRAFLLIPIDTCLWDITGPGGPPTPPDGTVGINDYLEVLARWGPCPAGGICMADFDCNLDVGINDLLELNAHWGACPPLMCPYVGGGESSSGSGGDDDASGLSADDVEDALEELGFDDMEEFGAWMDGASETERAAVIAVLTALLV